MKVLMTGAAGYIAQWLAPKLWESGHEVAGIDIRATAMDPQRHAIQPWWVCGDLLDPAVFKEMIRSTGPDVVVHLAAKYGRVFGEINPETTVQLNTEMTTLIARECGDVGVPLLYASSSEVYGDGNQSEDERFLIEPKNLYGLTKKWGEEVSRLYAPEGLNIVRLNMPYGPGGLVGYGRNALHTMLWKAYHRMRIQVHEGTYRSYTWAGDAVEGIRLILESGETGTWNVCRDDQLMSSEEVAQAACDIAGTSHDLIDVVPAPDGVTRTKLISSDRLVEQLGWKPRVDFQEGVAETYGYVMNYDRNGRWSK